MGLNAITMRHIAHIGLKLLTVLKCRIVHMAGAIFSSIECAHCIERLSSDEAQSPRQVGSRKVSYVNVESVAASHISIGALGEE